MSFFGNARNSSLLIKMAHRNQVMASLLYNSSRHFSTGAGQPGQEISFDSFLKRPSTGLVYGRLTGIRKHTTKTDILNMLEGSNLSLEDVKFDYNRNYFPMAVLVQFPNPESYDAGIKSIIRKGRMLKVERTDRNQWDVVRPYDGKAILLQGIPRNASSDEIERFLSGCQYDSSSITMLTRPAFPDPIRIACVHFPSRALAMHAFITKNRGFCLNNQILVEVLQFVNGLWNVLENKFSLPVTSEVLNFLSLLERAPSWISLGNQEIPFSKPHVDSKEVLQALLKWAEGLL